jgi:hypothetical protein
MAKAEAAVGSVDAMGGAASSFGLLIPASRKKAVVGGSLAQQDNKATTNKVTQ